MAKNVPIVFRFGALDGISNSVAQINKNFKELSNTAETVKKKFEGFKKAGEALQDIGTKMSLGITAPVAAAAALSVKNFGDFENSMLGVKTLLDEGSFGAKGLQKGFKEMSSEALKAVSEIPVELEHTTKALFDSVSAGIDAGKAVGFVRTSAKLAVAGLTEVSVATDGMTSALNAYKMDAAKADVVASKFFSAQKFGKTTIAQLADGFGMVGAIGASTGVSFNELLAATSAVTLGGIRTNSAYTGLKAALTNMIKPTAEAKEEAERLGIQFDGNSLRSKGFKGMLDSITSAQGYNADSMTKLFGSVEALNVMMALSGKQSGDFSNILVKLGNDTETLTTFQNAYANQSASMNNKMKLFQNKALALSISLGEKLAPSLIKVTDLIAGAMTWFEAHPKIAKFTAVVMGLLAVLGPVIVFFGTVLALLPSMIAGFAVFSSGLAILSGWFASLAIVGTIINVAIGFFTTLGAIIAGVTLPVWGIVALIGVAFALVWKYWDKIKEVGAKIANWTKGLFGFGDNEANVNLNKKATIENSITGGLPSPESLVKQQTVNNINNQSAAGKKNETELKVSFENMPKGTRVKTEKEQTPLNLNLGYSMGH
jgi:TP901 family phage tail tape measure protein